MSRTPGIYPTASGKYEVRWREGERHRSRTFTLQRDAQAWKREVSRRAQLGPLAVQQLTVKGISLNRWVATRWVPEHASALEVKTRDRYANSYQVHIEPWLGHLPIRELTVGTVRRWQAERLAAGVSAHALMKARTVLSSVLRHAAEAEEIPGNPMTLVRPPKAAHAQDVIPLSALEVERIRTLLRLRDATMVALLAYSGMRPGELRALRWGDVGKNTIRVQNGSNPDGSIKRTKNRRGRRSIRLIPALAEDLAAWRRHSGGRGAQRVFPGSGVEHGITEEGWSNWRDRDAWVPARDQVIDFKPTPYHLRHTWASLLLAEGRTIHYVAEQLGHDAGETQGRYGHVIAEYADDINIDIDQTIATARDTAAGWTPPTPRRESGLGVTQRGVLLRARAAGPEGLTFHVWNDRRRANSLTARGLLAHVHGTGSASRYRLTTRGEEAATHEEMFGHSSEPTRKGARK